MSDLLDQQRQVERELCAALIEAIPEMWRAVTLTVDHGPGGLVLGIANPDGNRERIPISWEIEQSIEQLLDLYRKRGVLFQRASYVLRHDGESWKYEGTFETKPQG